MTHTKAKTMHPGSAWTRRFLLLSTGLALGVIPAHAQDPGGTAPADTATARRGAEFLIPLGSVFLPGLGQYVYGSTTAGLGFTGTAVAGLALSGVGDALGDTWDDAPRRGRDQLADQALHVALTSAYLSAWDSFHRAVPDLQRQGRYEFLGPRDQLTELITAPFDTRFLRRWTTWVDLAQTFLIAGLILSDRKGAAQYHAYRPADAAWTGSLSLNSAVGEEALFRGWLLPMLHQKTGERFWAANGIQATVFGAGHLDPGAPWAAAYIGAWALWEGWVTRRNDWSVRESTFHHFWYNAVIITASLLVDEQAPELRITFPTIRF